MIESHLKSGSQKLVQTPEKIATLEYGKSVTDACLGWDESVELMNELAAAVRSRRESGVNASRAQMHNKQLH
jgi:3-deoxy-7-phosphoheptulonate synthase